MNNNMPVEVVRGLLTEKEKGRATAELLSRPVRYLKGVGEKTAELFARLGVFYVGDLLQLYPRLYEDRGNIVEISELEDGATCAIKAIAAKEPVVSRPRRGFSVCKCSFFDKSGQVKITWFNQPYIKEQISVGEEYVLHGKVKFNGYLPEMINPICEKLSENMSRTCRIVPIYPATAGLTQNTIRKCISNALELLAGNLKDAISGELRQEYSLAEFNYALENIHFPKSDSDFRNARRRLVFQELLTMQLALFRLRRKNELEVGIGKDAGNRCVKFPSDIGVRQFADSLPFALTGAQKRVLLEIFKDMESEKQMNRLVQGDVGSGKTAVAAVAIYKTVKSGYQAAMMAPTEILAEQHYKSLQEMFEPFGIKVGFVSGSLTAAQKRNVNQQLAEGGYDVLVGTHALIEDGVVFKRLGLVITDEQHRFGVKQRGKLLNKRNADGSETMPDSLVMTATPIPRTLALILYGDLDISIIDELPPGRQNITTWAINESKYAGALNFIKEEIKKGRQAYIVCPLVEESDNEELHAVEKTAENLSKNEFKEFRTSILHGKMHNQDKKRVADDFAAGKIDVLIATTVVEVGINVPNATVMLIENAERFGLAQLHQLRGRVGRGSEQSYCILYCQRTNKLSYERMKVMTETNDGFVISEKDLQLRGPGDFFGTMQHGLPDFKIANLYNDLDILKEAQELSQRMIETGEPAMDVAMLGQLADDLFNPIVESGTIL